MWWSHSGPWEGGSLPAEQSVRPSPGLRAVSRCHGNQSAAEMITLEDVSDSVRQTTWLKKGNKLWLFLADTLNGGITRLPKNKLQISKDSN